MLRLLQSIRTPASVLVGLLLFVPTASAQLKLPKEKVKDTGGSNLPTLNPSGKPKPAANGVVPHLVCTKCQEHNYVSRMNRPEPGGTYIAWCAKCGRDRSHSRAATVAESARLNLPSGKPAPRPSGAESTTSGATGGSGSARYGDTAADFIIREVRSRGHIQGTELEKAVESLIGLEEEGRVTSRIVLHDTNPAVALTAGRVLVRGGVDEDAERVVARLRTQMPSKSGAFLLEELVQRDPVHGSPDFLVEMLEHKQKLMRTKAERLLEDRLSPAILPQLRETMSSKRSDTRLAAIRLVQRIEDPAVLEILLDHLDDSSARVADVVVKALASHPDDALDLTLLARALNGNWILRQHAFAILAIVEREDELLRPIFDDRHAELLLKGLRSRDTLVHGTCAAALAGIGFRSSQPDATEWLDREVTGTMIASISGREFFSDFGVMQPRVLRRLRLLTGENFGTDGPEWTRWWIGHRSDFYAHRAFLRVPRDGEGTLELHFRGTGTEGGAFSLYGLDSWASASKRQGQVGEQLILNHRECVDLIALLEREGVLGPELAPGVRGNKGFGERGLDVVINGQGKSFVFGAGRISPWFERVTGAMADVRARNRWQRYRPTEDYPDALTFWDQESGWWAGDRDVTERALRLKDLVFRSVRDMPPSYRRVALRELTDLYATPGVPAGTDFQLLLDLLRDEGFFTERADQLVDLGILAARAQADGSLGELDRKLATQLVELLMARFSTKGLEAMGRIAAACGRDFVEDLASDPQPMKRAVAAAQLAVNPNQEERMLLIEMLDDIEPLVQASAASALGAAKVEEARIELLLRARIAAPLVRASALRAVAQLGGDHVLEALVTGVADSDPEVKRGAAEGLTILADPQSTPILISLLRQGRESDTFETARKGLIALGEDARRELRRTVSSEAHSTRRECALLLALMGDPWVANPMIKLLNSRPNDREMAFELAVLTCVDFSGEVDAAINWQEWYDDVTHEDSTAWFIAALERKGMAMPPAANFKPGPGAREGGLLLLALLRSEEDYLAERARRDLSKLLGGDLGDIPVNATERAAWLLALRETILKRFES